MSNVYDRLSDAAVRLLDRFDQGGTQVVIKAVVPNPDPLLPPAVVETQEPIKAVARGVDARIMESVPDLIAGDIQIITDRRFVPVAGNAVLLNGQQRRIVRVEPIPAAGQAVAYRFFVR